MRKATLSPNPTLQAKQRFIVSGLPEADRIITRDAISMEFGEAERPDNTKVPLGRTEPGEFSITLDFADDVARQAYLRWFLQAKDRAGENGQLDNPNGSAVGIDPDYKRDATVVYHRLMQDGQHQPIRIKLIGCWVKSTEFPDFDMDGEDTCTLSLTISYDDVQPLNS